MVLDSLVPNIKKQWDWAGILGMRLVLESSKDLVGGKVVIQHHSSEC